LLFFRPPRPLLSSDLSLVGPASTFCCSFRGFILVAHIKCLAHAAEGAPTSFLPRGGQCPPDSFRSLDTFYPTVQRLSSSLHPLLAGRSNFPPPSYSGSQLSALMMHRTLPDSAFARPTRPTNDVNLVLVSDSVF